MSVEKRFHMLRHICTLKKAARLIVLRLLHPAAVRDEYIAAGLLRLWLCE